MKYAKLLIILCLFLLLSSCIHPVQLEDLGIVLTRGVDTTEKGEVEVTMAILQFIKDAPNATKTISGTGNTIKAAVKNANKKANQEIVVGKLELQIFGRETAEEGLHPYLDTLRRDANIPNTLVLAVSKGQSKDIFHADESKIDTSLGEFLHGLILPSVEERLFPAISLPKFNNALFNSGIDPILPIIGVTEGVPTIVGIALFKDDKMVGELSTDNEELIKVMEGTVHDQFIDVNLPTKTLEKYLVHPKRANKKETINMLFLIEKGTGNIALKNKEQLKFSTDIEMILNMQEISEPYEFDNPKAIQQMEKEVEKYLEKKYKKILSKMKEVNSDPFGYGIKYRMKTRQGKLSKKTWDELYPKIDVDFNVHVKIIRHGEVHR